MIGTAAALVLPGLVNYAIMEGALRLRDARYVKWSDGILAELKECARGLADYGRYLDPNSRHLNVFLYSSPIVRNRKLNCPHEVRNVPSNPLCKDGMCSSLQPKVARILSGILTQEESYNANRTTSLLALALTVFSAVCAILFLQPVGLTLLPLTALRLGILGNSLLGAFLAIQSRDAQYSRFLAYPDGFLSRTINLEEPGVKRLVCTPDMIREIDLGAPLHSEPGLYFHMHP